MDEFMTGRSIRSRQNRKKEKGYFKWLSLGIGLLGIPMVSPLYGFIYLAPIYLFGLLLGIMEWENKKTAIAAVGTCLNTISLLWSVIAWGILISIWIEQYI
ncbi:MAG: hypothetical protein AB2421_03665 [Thermotaleaceae bacterium]